MHTPYNNFLTKLTRIVGLLSLVSCLALSVTNSVMAQSFDVSGQVVDAESGEPIPGASIVEVGTQTGTITDADGEFSLAVSGSDASLRISFVGYDFQVVDLNNRSEITVNLEQSLTQLDDVVVTAFGMERERKALGYSVTQVDGAELAQAREVNLGDALQGRVAGVNVSNIGSGVGGSSRVVIRGNTSLSGNNEPLYVIDGIPMDNTQLGSASMWGGSDWGDGLTSLNPDDIENISVLKGATAAALWGSRASNGVVLITTKNGSGTQRDGIGVEINSNLTLESFINTYDFQNEYGHGTDGRAPATADEGFEYGASAWGSRLDGSDVYQFDGVQRPYVANDDNYKNFYDTGFTNTNTVAVTGGTANQSFRLSLSDLRTESIVPNSGMNRQTVMLSSNGRWADRLNVDTKLQYTREDVKNRARLSDAPGNANYTLAVLPPSINVLDLKGPTDKLGALPDGTEMLYTNNNFSQNPYWATYQFVNDNIRDRFMGSGTVRFDLTDGLFVRGRAGMDWYTNRRTNLEPYGTAYKTEGEIDEIEQRVREINLEYMLGFQEDVGEDFGVSGIFGGSWMRHSYEQLNGSASEFNIPFLHTISNGGAQGISYDFSEFGINSLFGSAEVSWRDLVYVTATARNDWFSTLPVDSNSILYPSIGASFVFSDAFDLPEVITFGKLRASWAQVGGGTDPYKLALNYSLVGQGHQGAALGQITQDNVPNNALVPLTLEEYEIGFDVRLFNNRVGIDYAYYNKKTTDDILDATISGTSGYSGATVNVGEVSNTGHEFLVTVAPVRNINFAWDVTANISYNENTVDQLYQDASILNVQDARNQYTSSQHRIAYTDEDGEYFSGGYSVIVGRKHLRMNGQKVYDEDGLPVWDPKQRVLGSGIHPWAGGLQNNFSYKNFNFGFLVDFKFGGEIFSGTNSTAYSSGMHKATLEGRETGLTITGVDEAGNPQTWEIAASDPEGEGLVTIQNYYSELSQISEYFVQDASFVKLRSLTFGYQLPARILSSLPFSDASLSIVGRNLWLIYSEVDNVDPESTYNTSNGQGLEWFGVPQTRSFGLNLNLKF